MRSPSLDTLEIVVIVVFCITFIALLLGFILPIFQAKKLNPKVRSFYQAIDTLKQAKEIVYQRTGIKLNSFSKIKAYLEKNGLLPLNFQNDLNDNTLDK